MVLYRSKLLLAFTIFISMIGGNVYAASDNGPLKLELQDPVAVGMGGAFVGESDRASAVFYNPAGITQIDSPEASIDLTWAQPQMKYESSSSLNGVNYTAEMKEENFIFPNIFVTSPIIKDKLYLGIGESSDFGGGYNWEPNSFSRYTTIKDSIQDQDYRLVAAYKITDQWSIAGGPVNDQSHFEHYQGLYQVTADGNSLFKANDNAWGFDLATLYKINDKNQIGLDYKSPIHHQYSGTLYMSGLNTIPIFAGGTQSYQSIFGGPNFSTSAIQKLTLPQSVTLGYSAKPINKWTFNFDLEWTDWSQYKQQTTYYPNVNAAQASVLATDNPTPRKWNSVWSESLGAQYDVTEAFRVRLGYQHHQTPVPKNTFDTEFPDSDSNAVTVGFGYDLTKNLTVDIAYVADFYQSRNIANSADPNLQAGQTSMNGKYSAFVNTGMLSLTYKF